MQQEEMTMNEIRKAGIDALSKALGPVGMVRFLQQFDFGKGDYTKERAQNLDKLTVADIVKEIKDKRKKR